MRVLAALLAGALIALVAWWPLTGAASAVFWPKVFDAEGPDDIAIKTILLEQEDTFYSLVRKGPDIGQADNCAWKLDEATMKGLRFMSGPALLSVAIHHERNNENYLDVRIVAEQAMHSLPNVALGALQGCVQGSLLAGACRRYVAQRLRVSLAAHEVEIRQKTVVNDANAIRASCAALQGTR